MSVINYIQIILKSINETTKYLVNSRMLYIMAIGEIKQTLIILSYFDMICSFSIVLVIYVTLKYR